MVWHNIFICIKPSLVRSAIKKISPCPVTHPKRYPTDENIVVKEKCQIPLTRNLAVSRQGVPPPTSVQPFVRNQAGERRECYEMP